MNSIIWAGDLEYSTIQFEWFLVDWCNYSCSYCSEASNMVEYNKSTMAGKYQLVLARLRRMDCDFTVELIGGEPTLHPDIIEILSELNAMSHCVGVEVVTNATRGDRFFSNLGGLGLDKVKILASYHPEYGGDIEHYARINEYFAGKFGLAINVSDRIEHWDGTVELINGCLSRGINYSLNLLTRTDVYVPEYTAEFWDRFGEYFGSVASRMRVPYYIDGAVRIYSESEIARGELNRFAGYKCSPIRYRITHTGDVLNFCTRKTVSFSLNNSTLNRVEICPRSKCECDALYVFYKERT